MSILPSEYFDFIPICNICKCDIENEAWYQIDDVDTINVCEPCYYDKKNRKVIKEFEKKYDAEFEYGE